MQPEITGLRPTPRFEGELRDLPVDLLRQAMGALDDLLKKPVPKARRLHRLNGYRHPSVYTIDVTPNKSHKLSFHIDETVAVLRRISTHKHIDRNAYSRPQGAGTSA